MAAIRATAASASAYAWRPVTPAARNGSNREAESMALSMAHHSTTGRPMLARILERLTRDAAARPQLAANGSRRGAARGPTGPTARAQLRAGRRRTGQLIYSEGGIVSSTRPPSRALEEVVVVVIVVVAAVPDGIAQIDVV